MKFKKREIIKIPKVINEIKYWEKSAKKLKLQGYDPSNILKLIKKLKNENKKEIKNINKYNEYMKERNKFYKLNKAMKKSSYRFEDITNMSEDLNLQNPFSFYDYTPKNMEEIKNANKNLLEIFNENKISIGGKYRDEEFIIKLMLENPYNFYDSEQRKAIFRNNDLEWKIALSNLKDVLHNKGTLQSPKIMKMIKENLKNYKNSSDQLFDIDEAVAFMESGWL